MDNVLFINRVDRTSLIINLKEKLTEINKNIGLIVASDNEFCCSKRFIDYFKILPEPDKKPLEIIIKEIVEKYNVIGICVASNYDLIPLLKIRKWLDNRNINLVVPERKTVELCLSKKKLYNWLSSKGIQVPPEYSYEELIKNQSKGLFPIIVKPSSGQGSVNTYKISNYQELAKYYSEISSPIIQKYIEGIHYTIDCFSDENEKPIIIVPRIRIIVGISSCLVTKIDMKENIIALALKIANSIKIIGPWNIQLIANSDGLFVHDINPRLASGMIFSIKAGVPFDRYLLEMLIYGKILNREYQITDGIVIAKRYTEEILDLQIGK